MKPEKLASRVHENIGANLMAKGYSALRCGKCNTERKLEPGEVGRYMAHGWPVCCGETMRLLIPSWTPTNPNEGK